MEKGKAMQKPARNKQRNKSVNKEAEKNKEETQITEKTLPNNWLKYEISDESEEQSGANFEALSNEPISQDSYFKFKYEQNWENEIEQLQLSKYFTLDLKVLSEGITCVPFTERQELEESLFSASELDSFQKNVATCLTKYEKYLKQRFPVKNTKAVTCESSNVKHRMEEKDANKNKKNNEVPEQTVADKKTTNQNAENVETKSETDINLAPKQPRKRRSDNKMFPEKPVEVNQKTALTVTEVSKSPEDDVDELLNLKVSNVSLIDNEVTDAGEDPLLAPAVTIRNVAPQPAVDLEQWLDDILDD